MGEALAGLDRTPRRLLSCDMAKPLATQPSAAHLWGCMGRAGHDLRLQLVQCVRREQATASL